MENHTFSKMEANSYDLDEFLTKYFPFGQKYFLSYITFQSFFHLCYYFYRIARNQD